MVRRTRTRMVRDASACLEVRRVEGDLLATLVDRQGPDPGCRSPVPLMFNAAFGTP
jgi:hypothetical protein